MVYSTSPDFSDASPYSLVSLLIKYGFGNVYQLFYKKSYPTN